MGSSVSSLNTTPTTPTPQPNGSLMLAIKVQHQTLSSDSPSVTFPSSSQLSASLLPLDTVSPTLVCTVSVFPLSVCSDPSQSPFPLMDTAQSLTMPEDALKCPDSQLKSEILLMLLMPQETPPPLSVKVSLLDLPASSDSLSSVLSLPESVILPLISSSQPNSPVSLSVPCSHISSPPSP